MDEQTQLAWDIYFAGLVHMSEHPGYLKPGTEKPSLTTCAAKADAMILMRLSRSTGEFKWPLAQQ